MTEEQRRHLERAETHLAQALAIAEIAIEAAAVSAYTAAFHATAAYVSEPDRGTPKTHSGMKSRLHEVRRLRDDLPYDLVAQYVEAEDIRHVAVYGDQRQVSDIELAATLRWAESFVAAVRQALA